MNPDPKEAIAASTTHGMTNTRVFNVWVCMKQRCSNTRHKSYKDYGGRGIAVCERWLKFESFLADMGEPPRGFWLERDDNDKGYSKDNCRWASPKEQGNNKRSNKKIIINGVTKSLMQWCEPLRDRKLLHRALSIVARLGAPTSFDYSGHHQSQTPD